ncbi:MAG: tyrosine-type recombinase/integrase [Lachnospiraceae bacterium]|nr:tyrosine-type recombinase/integrase [Lachnospiraceae bacterium]MBQ6995825.1 tyrosine-type recombinase/integrase [Lachnospiraceae bacterium]
MIYYLESDREYEGWLPIITVLLGTGMRIGECIALRWEDLDFENRMISVNHNLSER